MAWHHEMIRVHARLRDALDVVQDAVAHGRDVPAPERELLLYCHGFCTALSGHHAAEDDRLLPALEQARPDLRPVIDQLRHDHGMIEHLLHALRSRIDAGAAPAEIERHVDGVAAIMESHFRHEERMLLGPLADLALDASPHEAFGPLAL